LQKTIYFYFEFCQQPKTVRHAEWLPAFTFNLSMEGWMKGKVPVQLASFFSLGTISYNVSAWKTEWRNVPVQMDPFLNYFCCFMSSNLLYPKGSSLVLNPFISMFLVQTKKSVH
jgi:hypothetical protein